MYAYVDRHVESLCNGGRFLLWAMRGWTQSIERGACPAMALSRGFMCMYAAAALPDFHIALAIINKDGLARMSLAPMKHPRIVEDEAVLLTLWRDLSLGRIDQVKETLILLVEEEAVSPVSRAMTMAAAKMLAAGLELSELSLEPTKEMK